MEYSIVHWEMMKFLPLETFVLPHVTLVMSYTPVVLITLRIVRVMGAGVIVMLHMHVEEVMCDPHTIHLV